MSDRDATDVPGPDVFAEYSQGGGIEKDRVSADARGNSSARPITVEQEEGNNFPRNEDRAVSDRAPEVTPWLKALRDDDPGRRRRAADFWAAAAESLSQAVPALVEGLADRDRDVREGAVHALGNLNRQTELLLPTLRAALRRAALLGDDESLRSLAVKALMSKDESSRPRVTELVDALGAAEAPLRFSAAQALGERGPQAEAAVGRLVQVTLHDPDPGVRIEAAMALFRIGGQAEKVVPLLVDALQDPSEVRRWIAADCLGAIGPAAELALPALRAALRRERETTLIRKALTLALEKIERMT